METIILLVHVLIAVGVIGLIMLQQGKGAETGASFGSGASQTVFGGQGSSNFLSRTTAILATIFFITSISLAVLARQKADSAANSGIPAVRTEQSAPTNDAPFSVNSLEGSTENDAPVLGSQPTESTNPASSKQTK